MVKFIDKFKNNWKKKSLFGKIIDVIFYLLIILLIIPGSRTEMLGFINRIKANIIQPTVKEANKAHELTLENYNWELQGIDGTNLKLSDYSEKIIFLNFWATWCPPCIGEMPGIQKLYDKFKENDNVKFIVISYEEPEKVKSFINRKNYTFPVYTAKYQAPGIFASKGIPVTFLISEDRKIVIKEIGAADWGGDKMIKIIEDLLKANL